MKDYPEIELENTTWINTGNPAWQTEIFYPDDWDWRSWEEWWRTTNQDDTSTEEPEPYNCVGDECIDDVQTIVVTFTPDEVESIISNFKSDAERYYKQWDENQDKKLIKYSLQIINSCDIYREQVKTEDSITQESLEEFKSNVVALKSKIEKYINWEEDIQTFVQPNFNDEYGWDWKEEIQDFINNREN